MKRDGLILLYDNRCNLCCGSVEFIRRRDCAGRIRLVAIESADGRGLLSSCGLTEEIPDSLVLLEDGVYYTCSTAALRVARRLSGLWPLLYGLVVIPRPVRDYVYDFIARRRYRWFGRRDQCSRVDSPSSGRVMD